MSYRIAVRELVEFTAKAGDLDLRFTPAPTAQEGIEGHRVAASRRGPGYRAEVPLAAEFGALSLRGRADGYDPGRQLLEEVKTYRGDLSRLPDNQRALHWAQAKLYGAMLCADLELEALDIAIVYFDVGSQKETPATQSFTAWELQAFFHEHCSRFLQWAQQEMAHRQARDASLATLRFPHPEFRHGQRLLAEGVYRAARDGQCLLAQAPTGIGKTIGTLFPLLKALPGQQIDRVFFLTAKTPGRALALEALRLLGAAEDHGPAPAATEDHGPAPADGVGSADGVTPVTVTGVTPSAAEPPDSPSVASSNARSKSATALTGAPDAAAPISLTPIAAQGTARHLPLRVLELTARDKACLHPDKECHGGSCPLAKGFYDRLPAARAAAIALADAGEGISAGVGSTTADRSGASNHHLLDQPTLQRLAEQHQVCPYYLSQELARWSDVVVGDYNYFFDVSALLHGLTVARDWKVAVLADEAHNLVDRAREMYSAELQPAALAALRKLVPAPLKRPLGRLQKAWDALHDSGQEYACRDELPADFVAALQASIVKIADYQTAHPLETGPELLRFYFDALHFQNLLERFGAHSFIDILTPRHGAGNALRIRNVVPAPHLAERLRACHTLTLFSATLTPPELHRHLLGLPETTVFLDVPSPFDARQLKVRIVDRISTRYRDREASLAPIADLMAAQYQHMPGNYLAFFSSHDYLQRALAVFRAAHPGIPVREQARAMDEAARRAFLDGFGTGTQGIAFAVLGGAFGEGIDLPGERLIGAFVATLGLPQVNAMNEKVMDCLQAHFGAGYDYTYLYPGLQKVVQAAGRVIRRREDRGVVYLIDDRFRQGKVRALLPGWWQVD